MELAVSNLAGALRNALKNADIARSYAQSEMANANTGF